MCIAVTFWLTRVNKPISHELYIYANTLDMHQNFVPKLNGRYLSSNVNITVADKHGNPVSAPVGGTFVMWCPVPSLCTSSHCIAERFVKFKTRK